MLPSGTRLGPYEVVAPLGAGGMGEVYRARDPRLGREVAVKVLPASASGDADRLRRFEQEARAAGSLDHPNVLAVHDVGVHDDAPYVVSELLEGETLRRRLNEGALPPRKATEYLLQITQGLAAAHEKRIVHRDLKPENLFITRDGRVKILDFGLAKLLRSASPDAGTLSLPAPATATGAVLGTVGYMAPEQIRHGPVDHRADIFSMGAVFHEMLSGRRTFRGETPAETMTAILKEDPPELPASVPAALDRIARRCLEKRPEERFQSARDVAFALDAVSGTPGPRDPALAKARPGSTRRLGAVAAALAMVTGLAAGILAGRHLDQRRPPSFHQLTFRRGTIWSARFSPDGQSYAYGAAWDGNPVQVFTSRVGSSEFTPLPLPAANLLGMSGSGEMALSLGHRNWGGRFYGQGTLARAPLAGGAPREVLEDAHYADWAPDGRTLAVVRTFAGHNRLEYPIGKVLYQTDGWISHPRVSPHGDSVAFLDHPGPADPGSVAVVDLGGRKTTLSAGWFTAQGLAWRPDGREVWFTAARTGGNASLRAVTLTGQERLILQVPARLSLHDIFRDGRALIAREGLRIGVTGLAAGETSERDLSWLDSSVVSDLSADGTALLLDESGEGAGSTFSTYLRRMDGSAAVRLGEGVGSRFSPDGKRALAICGPQRQRLALLPIGTGEVQEVERGGITSYRAARWFPDGKRILFASAEAGRGMRLYLQVLDGGKPRPLTPEGVSPGWDLCNPISPDNKWVTAVRADRRIVLYPVEGSEPRELAALEPGEKPVQWDVYGRSLYVMRSEEVRARVYRLDVSTGRRELWKEVVPPDPVGVFGFMNFMTTPDARSYAYTYMRQLSELYLVEGLE